ncbi:MAG: hypothetical protein QXL18_02765 [Candidatus Woesearchaeota archaeon]
MKHNVKDIASTIIEEGYMIGKNNAVNISNECDALEIYKRIKPKKILGIRINKKPVYIGTLYLNKTIEDEKWYFDNNIIGKNIEDLTKKLEKTYNVKVELNDNYYVLWGKNDPGF